MSAQQRVNRPVDVTGKSLSRAKSEKYKTDLPFSANLGSTYTCVPPLAHQHAFSHSIRAMKLKLISLTWAALAGLAVFALVYVQAGHAQSDPPPVWSNMRYRMIG